MGLADGRFPERLQLGKQLFAQVAALAPALGIGMQVAQLQLPVGVGGMRRRPSLHFFDQRQALGPAGLVLLLELLQPRFNLFVRLVAGFVEFFPKGLVGCPPLIGGFPLFAQLAQRLLHLAPTQTLPLRGEVERHRLGQQFFAQLVGAPALPAFEFAAADQRRLGLGLEGGRDVASMVFEQLAQSSGSLGCRFAVPLCQLLLQRGHSRSHSQAGLLLPTRLLERIDGRWRGLTPQGAQFVGPNRYRWQGHLRVACSGQGLSERGVKGFPDQVQLVARGVELQGVFGFEAFPDRVG